MPLIFVLLKLYSISCLFFRKCIPLVILEEGSYEKDVLFYVNLGEPQMVGGKVLSYEISSDVIVLYI